MTQLQRVHRSDGAHLGEPLSYEQMGITLREGTDKVPSKVAGEQLRGRRFAWFEN